MECDASGPRGLDLLLRVWGEQVFSRLAVEALGV